VNWLDASLTEFVKIPWEPEQLKLGCHMVLQSNGAYKPFCFDYAPTSAVWKAIQVPITLGGNYLWDTIAGMIIAVLYFIVVPLLIFRLERNLCEKSL
jgi:hypothetical protein